MNKNDHKIKIFENFQKTALYVFYMPFYMSKNILYVFLVLWHLANAHHSSKFQIDTSIFDLKS